MMVVRSQEQVYLSVTKAAAAKAAVNFEPPLLASCMVIYSMYTTGKYRELVNSACRATASVAARIFITPSKLAVVMAVIIVEALTADS